MVPCKCGCGEMVAPPRKYVNKEHQMEHMLRGERDKPRPAKRSADESSGQMMPCKCGCGEQVRSPRKYVNREHQLEHMLNGAARAMNTQQPHEAKVRGGKTAGEITAAITRETMVRVRARQAAQRMAGTAGEEA